MQKKLDNKKFKESVGIPKVLFELIMPVLIEKINILHRNGGRNSDLCVEDLLLMTLKYYRDYPTFSNLGLIFGILSERYRSHIKMFYKRASYFYNYCL